MTGAVFLALLLVGLPIGFVLMGTAVAYVYLTGNTTLYASFMQQLFAGLESYGLLAIPLFMLTGEVMNAGGLTRRLVAMASVLVGGLRGGLAYVNLLANVMMAAIMGSAVAQIAVMSRVMTPEMERRGYDRAFAAALTAAGGLLSPIIPPSMLFVIFGVLAQIAIGDLFIAGILPGLILAGAFLLVVAVMGFVHDFPRVARPARAEALRALAGGLPALAIPGVIIGGILLGWATPTESAALAVLAALVIGRFVHGELSLAALPRIFVETAIGAATVAFLIAAANVFGWVLLYEQVPQRVARWAGELTSDPFLFMLLVNAMLLVVGMVIDGIAAVIMVVPILLPIATGVFGIDPYHFGVVVCINLVLGLLTPPVGAGLYVAAGMARTSPTAVFRALLPFLGATLAVLVLLSWQPRLVTLLIGG
ncbi:MAG: C4-dicarboxylate ABC transporter permease [Paracoccaceae bacterium]|nr:MAG: TRAP transporter large permease [Alphaproteobacteria bacterium]GIX12665.1 MAG: C4-dicarboxylate ABC transporter permease [Paracoccaceae bacterium]